MVVLYVSVLYAQQCAAFDADRYLVIGLFHKMAFLVCHFDKDMQHLVGIPSQCVFVGGYL